MALRSSRVAAIRRRLLDWWDAGHRDLPWRALPGAAPDPYRIWISEVMLQQTRVEAVIPRYAAFLTRFPTLEALASAPADDLLALWAGLGYYARARNLMRAARDALARNGELPHTLEALRALPGFGPYTAGAVASLAFGIRAPAVDGNVSRVLARMFAIELPPASAASRAKIAGLAEALVPADRPGDWNQALMDLGATVCRRPAPACARCPLEPECEARAAGRERELPLPRARKALRSTALACAVVRDGDAVLVVRREGEGLFGGLWELPSAEVLPSATAAGALAARGFHVGRELARITRLLTHRRLTLLALTCEIDGPPLAGGRFVRPEELARLGLSTAMRRLVQALPPEGPHDKSTSPRGMPLPLAAKSGMRTAPRRPRPRSGKVPERRS